MPFVENMPEEEEQQNQPTSTGPVSPSGGGGGVHLAPSTALAPAGGGNPQPGGNPSNPAGGQFASLNQYVTANQAQAVPLSNKITSGITNQHNTLNNQNTSLLSNLNNQVSSGYTPNNSNALSAEAANPISFASNPGNVQTFQSLLNDVYNGPTSAESAPGYSSQQNAINQAINAGQQQVSTESGRKQLLQQQETVPTAGVTALDSAILSQSPQALSNVENAYKPFSGLLTNLSTGAQGVDQSIAQAQQNAAAASAASNNAIAQQTAALNSQLANELSTAQGNIAGYNADVGTLQKAANAYNTDINAFLAANPQIKAPTQADLNNWLNLQTYAGSPTLQTVATPQDYATAEALQTLNGANPVSTNINASTASQAGSVLPVNYQSILDALSNGNVTTAMNNEVQGIGNQITQAMAPFQAAQGQSNSGRQGFNAITGTTDIYKVVTPAAFPTLTNPATGQSIPAYITVTTGSGRNQSTTQQLNPEWTTLQKQAQGAMQTAEQGDQAQQNAAQGIQWVPQAATNYNNLLSQLQSSLAPVSQVQLPAQQTSSGSNTLSNIEKGALMVNPVTSVPMIAANQLVNSPNSALNAAVLLNPITTISTLAIPQSVLNSIGSGIKNVINDIGNFFGNLF